MPVAKDRFDALPKTPGRTGAHRGAVRRGGGWLGVVLIVVGIVICSTVGLWVAANVFKIKLDYDFPFLSNLIPAATETATPTPEPTTTDGAEVTARELRILVLNGTPYSGLQDTVAAQLQEAGWPAATTATTNEREIEKTVVYYVDGKNADVARGGAELLGTGQVRPVAPTVYPDQDIIIVIGMDSPIAESQAPQPAPTDAAPAS